MLYKIKNTKTNNIINVFENKEFAESFLEKISILDKINSEYFKLIEEKNENGKNLVETKDYSKLIN